MKVVTESFLRETFRKQVPETFCLEKGQILTPSARQLLTEKGVKLVSGDDPSPVKPEAEKAPEKGEGTEYRPVARYVSAVDGGSYEKKPEHMTQLHGNVLVHKDHPRIDFRGKVDELQAEILMIQHKSLGKKELMSDLGDILAWSREIMRAEVMDEALEERTILGLTDPELRERSHKPKKYFGIGHFLAEGDMGETILLLNLLRTRVRQVELVAVKAFRREYETGKTDIIQALNRMSSAIYIMMLKEKSGKYQEQ